MSTKYESLENYLRNQRQSTKIISKSFKELESIMGSKLPESAYKYRAWWSNQSNTGTRPQAKAWIAAGFRVESVRQEKLSGSVEFVRFV